MSNIEELLNRYETLTKVNKQVSEHPYAVGTFNYDENKIIVHWEKDGFSVYSSTAKTIADTVGTFEQHYQLDKITISEDKGTSFTPVKPNHYNDEWDVEIVKGYNEYFGFCANSGKTSRFPENEQVFWVFSDEKSFKHITDSIGSVHDVFPKLLGVSDDEKLFDEVVEFAMARPRRIDKELE